MVRIFYLSFDGVDHQIGRRRRVAILCVAAKQRPDFRNGSFSEVSGRQMDVSSSSKSGNQNLRPELPSLTHSRHQLSLRAAGCGLFKTTGARPNFDFSDFTARRIGRCVRDLLSLSIWVRERQCLVNHTIPTTSDLDHRRRLAWWVIIIHHAMEADRYRTVRPRSGARGYRQQRDAPCRFSVSPSFGWRLDRCRNQQASLL